jgi:hypothetical protein
MMIQSVLSARGIPAIIPGYSARSVTVAVTGFSTRVLVPASAAAEAVVLIAELRGDLSWRGPLELSDAAFDDPEEGGPEEGLAVLGEAELEAQRRRGMGKSAVVSLFLTFGAGHLFQRAYWRGFMLAWLQGLGIAYLLDEYPIGLPMVIGSILIDLLGSMVLASRQVTQAAGARQGVLPRARLLRGKAAPSAPRALGAIEPPR